MLAITEDAAAAIKANRGLVGHARGRRPADHPGAEHRGRGSAADRPAPLGGGEPAGGRRGARADEPIFVDPAAAAVPGRQAAGRRRGRRGGPFSASTSRQRPCSRPRMHHRAHDRAAGGARWRTVPASVRFPYQTGGALDLSLLKTIPLFADVPDEKLGKIAPFATTDEFAEGEVGDQGGRLLEPLLRDRGGHSQGRARRRAPRRPRPRRRVRRAGPAREAGALGDGRPRPRGCA